jgi:hypothetical protein
MTRSDLVLLLAISAVSLGAATSAQARETPEHIGQTIPPGFVLADQREQPGMKFSQYVLQGETAKDWSRAIIDQTFPSLYPPLPRNYAEYLVKQWQTSCPDAGKPVVASGYASGRPAATVELDCAKSPATGKPEHTFFQIIRGQAAIYIAQYAFRSEPTPAQKVAAVTFLQSFGIIGTAPATMIAPKKG